MKNTTPQPSQDLKLRSILSLVTASRNDRFPRRRSLVPMYWSPTVLQVSRATQRRGNNGDSPIAAHLPCALPEQLK